MSNICEKITDTEARYVDPITGNAEIIMIENGKIKRECLTSAEYADLITKECALSAD